MEPGTVSLILILVAVGWVANYITIRILGEPSHEGYMGAEIILIPAVIPWGLAVLAVGLWAFDRIRYLVTGK